ncbi:ImpA family type VI secretion system protein [Paraburkholderia sp. GAS199]|uniref:type VI secretion system protein TssA n=1 Tax=Paraburkholderia sp. GAS199 TaxID=3035126 RepID=UPI003D21A6FF
MSPIDTNAPCGDDLEYDPEFVVLSAQMAAKLDAQYGDFVGVPEPVNWTEVERDCQRLMTRSKDMRLAILFTRCRTKLAAALGLAEGIGLLAAWLTAFPDTLHPQPHRDEEREAALEIRMNAIQALIDPDGLLSDIREIWLTRSAPTRLQIRDVERAFAYPRPNDALAPESVAQQLEDLRRHEPEAFAGFDSALASLISVKSWCEDRLGAYQPDFSSLERLFGRLAYGDTQFSARPVTALSVELTSPGADAVAENSTTQFLPLKCDLDVYRTAISSLPAETATRDAALCRIREARHWFEQNEPSSPVPVLLYRAEKFVGKRFSDVVKAIPPDLLADWEAELQFPPAS